MLTYYSLLSSLVGKGTKLFSGTDMPTQRTAARIVEEQRRVRRLILDETIRVDDLPAAPDTLDALSPREDTTLFLPRDDFEPVRDELEAGERQGLLLGEHVVIKELCLLRRMDGPFSTAHASAPATQLKV